jgi:two-component system chemotaxis response regulator CheB
MPDGLTPETRVPRGRVSFVSRPIRVLLVDDSADRRTEIKEDLEPFPDVSVIGGAIDAHVAREKILRLRPDVVVLHVDAQGIDALTFIGRLMRHYPVPVVVLSGAGESSAELAVRALVLGAIDVVSMAETGQRRTERLVHAVRGAAAARVWSPEKMAPGGIPVVRSEPPAPAAEGGPAVCAIAAAGGGARAIETMVARFPKNAPATVIALHLPPGFAAPFAQRLDENSYVRVREAKTGDVMEAGTVLVAPGDRHVRLDRVGSTFVVRITDESQVNLHRPSADILFRSLADEAGDKAVGALLTGLGTDGARGLLAMRKVGAHTIVQDERSSVVFGMPREAILLRAASEVLPLGRIGPSMVYRGGYQQQAIRMLA